MAPAQPSPELLALGKRLRELREREFGRLTQGALGGAFGGAGDPLSPTTISMWETGQRIVPSAWLESYARLFCTPRSFEGGKVHIVSVANLTSAERDRQEELLSELRGLRDSAVSQEEQASSFREAQSMWHFPDGSRITLVCSRLPPERRPPGADPTDLNYVKFSDLADLDSLIEIYGAVKAHNPTSQVVIMAAQDLDQRDVASHLVFIGGRVWEVVTPWFSPIFPIPIEAGDPTDRGAIVVRDNDGGEHEFKYSQVDGKLVEDVGFFARGENPSAPRRTLTICNGITTRGVRGAARCFIDPEMEERNYQYLKRPQFPEGSTYCIVMRVPVVNNDPLTPDLSKKENRLFEWSNANSPEAG